MTNELATISNRISILDEKISTAVNEMRAPSEDAIAHRITMLENAGMKYDPNIRNAKAAYAFALKGLPHAALKIVTERLVQGFYPDRSQFMIPTPPELAALVRKAASPMTDTLARLKLTREALQPISGEDPDEIERQRVAIRARHEQYKADQAAFKATEASKRPAPLSEEEQNSLFRNKKSHANQPPLDPWDQFDRQQQEDYDNGKENRRGYENQGQGFHRDRPQESGQHHGRSSEGGRSQGGYDDPRLYD